MKLIETCGACGGEMVFEAENHGDFEGWWEGVLRSWRTEHGDCEPEEPVEVAVETAPGVLSWGGAYWGRLEDPAGSTPEEAHLGRAMRMAGFPRQEGPYTSLGPEVFSSTPDPVDDTVISWRGENFTVQPPADEPVPAGMVLDAMRERLLRGYDSVAKNWTEYAGAPEVPLAEEDVVDDQVVEETPLDVAREHLHDARHALGHEPDPVNGTREAVKSVVSALELLHGKPPRLARMRPIPEPDEEDVVDVEIEGPRFVVGRFGSTFVRDEHGERMIPPGTTDVATGIYYPATGEEQAAILRAEDRPRTTAWPAPDEEEARKDPGEPVRDSFMVPSGMEIRRGTLEEQIDSVRREKERCIEGRWFEWAAEIRDMERKLTVELHERAFAPHAADIGVLREQIRKGSGIPHSDFFGPETIPEPERPKGLRAEAVWDGLDAWCIPGAPGESVWEPLAPTTSTEVRAHLAGSAAQATAALREASERAGRVMHEAGGRVTGGFIGSRGRAKIEALTMVSPGHGLFVDAPAGTPGSLLHRIEEVTRCYEGVPWDDRTQAQLRGELEHLLPDGMRVGRISPQDGERGLVAHVDLVTVDATLPTDLTWHWDDVSMGPRECPICRSVGTGAGMPRHIMKEHGPAALADQRPPGFVSPLDVLDGPRLGGERV